MTIKLIALDLDGTLVNEALEISPRTLKVLSYILEQTDTRVVIATGRMYPSSIPFAKRIGVVDPIIAYQGAMIREHSGDEQVLHHSTIPLHVAQQLIPLLVDGGYHTNLYVNDQLFTNSTQEHAEYYAKISGVTPKVTDNLMDVLTDAPTKVMVIDDHRVDELVVQIRHTFPTEINVCKSRFNFCEMIDHTASKWNAIKILASRWGIRDEEVMAIGDHGNDVSMISQAGLGVAMGNAPEEIQALARYVTGSIHEDGAAEAIERFVLGVQPAQRELMPIAIQKPQPLQAG